MSGVDSGAIVALLLLNLVVPALTVGVAASIVFVTWVRQRTQEIPVDHLPKDSGIGLVILGFGLFFVGPVAAVGMYYLVTTPIAASIVGVTIPAVGACLIVVGAVRNSRRQPQPAPPTISY